MPRTFEAKAAGHFDRLELQECVIECARWLEDEPFSSRPVELSTFISVVAFEEYEEAISLARRGLISNPDSFLLRNNLCVALAESGRIDEANDKYRTIKFPSLSKLEETCWLATKGLLTFRELCYDEGREFYLRAVASAQVQSNRELQTMALIHWAREELMAGGHQRADEIVRQADEASRGPLSTIVQMAFSRFHKLRLGDRNEEPA